jgi:hypothetical protein
MLTIHSFLVRPQHKVKSPTLEPGTNVTTTGDLYELLKEIYNKAENNSTEVKFVMSDDGQQKNLVRREALAYTMNPSLSLAEPLAIRLAKATDGRSGTGLLFLMVGSEGGERKLVLSRFPADSGILAEQGETGLKVEFLKRIFMKSSKLYKSVSFKGIDANGSFWIGRAIDKQNSAQGLLSSRYWISDFLTAEFSTTPELGTKRLAEAMRDAAKATSDINIKHQISSLANLATGHAGAQNSPRVLLQQLGASDATLTAVREAFKKDHLWDEAFILDKAIFEKKLAYKMIQLDNGAHLMAQTDKFDDVFTVDETEGDTKEFSTRGNIVDEKLKATSR